MRRRALLAVATLLAACDAPDYTPVRNWAMTASLAAEPPATPEEAGLRAMRFALITYLSSLRILADDGTLPYWQDPFLALVPAATRRDAEGGRAVGGLGAMLRHATRDSYQAPDLRTAIGEGDPFVQALVASLLRDPGLDEAQRATLTRIGATHALLKAQASRITRPETVQRIQAAEQELRDTTLPGLPPPQARP